MRKKILSMSIAAVLTAVTSSSVMAFDTSGTSTSDTDGPIWVQGKTDSAGYEGYMRPAFSVRTSHLARPPMPSDENLRIAKNGRGDALIFPLFNQADDWGTEVVIRNTDKKHAIVAKVAVYATDDSREVLDFNVYLSASDVVRFSIENGNLISKDGSVLREIPAPSSEIDDVDADDFASDAAGKSFTRKLDIDSGYIVVYGMAQASTNADPSHDTRYHKQHASLFKNYREELDACRPDWRIGHQNAMDTGTYIRHTTNSSVDNFSVAAPNQVLDCSEDNIVAPIVKADTVRDDAKEAVVTAASIDPVLPVTINDAKDDADTVANAVATANVAGVATNVAVGDAVDDVDAVKVKVDAAAAAYTTAVGAADTIAAAAAAATLKTEILALTVAAGVAADAIDAAAALAVVATYMINASDGSSAVKPGNFFGDVGQNLTGTVRLYNATNGARDMMLPAKAIANFTAENKIIYTEGEISAFQDRRIVGAEWGDHDKDDNTSYAPVSGLTWAMYYEQGIRDDAKAFLVSNTTYTFAAASIANQLIITQPYKRPLVQLGNDDGYWQDVNLPDDFGGFSFIYNIFNEHEDTDNIAYTESPHNSGITILRGEVESMSNLEKDTEFKDDNGYALMKFTKLNGHNSGIPAVVTQMVGTTIGGTPQINWIYSQTQAD